MFLANPIGIMRFCLTSAAHGRRIKLVAALAAELIPRTFLAPKRSCFSKCRGQHHAKVCKLWGITMFLPTIVSWTRVGVCVLFLAIACTSAPMGGGGSSKKADAGPAKAVGDAGAGDVRVSAADVVVAVKEVGAAADIASPAADVAAILPDVAAADVAPVSPNTKKNAAAVTSALKFEQAATIFKGQLPAETENSGITVDDPTAAEAVAGMVPGGAGSVTLRLTHPNAATDPFVATLIQISGSDSYISVAIPDKSADIKQIVTTKFTVSSAICADLCNIIDTLECYESAQTAAGIITKSTLGQVLLDCTDKGDLSKCPWAPPPLCDARKFSFENPEGLAYYAKDAPVPGQPCAGAGTCPVELYCAGAPPALACTRHSWSFDSGWVLSSSGGHDGPGALNFGNSGGASCADGKPGPRVASTLISVPMQKSSVNFYWRYTPDPNSSGGGDHIDVKFGGIVMSSFVLGSKGDGKWYKFSWPISWQLQGTDQLLALEFSCSKPGQNSDFGFSIDDVEITCE